MKKLIILLIALFISVPAYSHTSRINRNVIIKIGTRITGATPGSLLFVDLNNKVAEDNANLFYDNATNQLKLGGTLLIKERTAAISSIAAFGQIWVKDGAPNTLFFTDDAGTDFQLGVGGGSVEGTAVLSTGESVGKVLQADGDNTSSWVTLPGGGDALTSNPLSQFAATTSLQFIGVISDETGTGLAVFNNAPTFIAPILGTPASGVATNLTGTASGLTAGNVTTNANLTGPITSIGNATTITANAVDDTHIDFGTGANQVSLDDMPEGTTAYYTYPSWNGSFKESFDADITSNGTVITMTVEQTGGGDLTGQFSSGLSIFDCTPKGTAGSTITLDVGTNTVPKANWIYILESAPTTLVKSTTAWPTTEHIKIGFFFVRSASATQTEGGAMVNQNWNNHLVDTNSQGHISHISQKLRHIGPTYFSGIDGNGATASYYTLGAANTEFISTEGIVEQLHMQTFPVFDTSVGDTVHVVNWSGDSYHSITDLFDITTDSTGAAISNNKFFNLVIWGVINKSGEHQVLMINLPSGSYNTQSGAQTDSNGFDDFSIPREFSLDSSNGFFIAKTTFQMGTTWSHVVTTDLRRPISGAGTSGIVSSFADNVFDVFGNVDNTKVMAFDVDASITTGTTRTYTAPDENGVLTLDSGTSALTNKTIDADNNTISNIGSAEITNDSIVNEDINSAAAISVSKTALTAGRSLTITTNDVFADAELYTVTKTIIIETPTSADNFIMFHVELGMQVIAAHAIVEDATSATVQFLQCDSAGDNCTEITSPIVAVVTGAADDGVIDAPDLDVDDYVRCNITATSGTPGAVTATLTMTMDD